LFVCLFGQVCVSPQQFAQYYFSLRSLLERTNTLGLNGRPIGKPPLDIDPTARTIQRTERLKEQFYLQRTLERRKPKPKAITIEDIRETQPHFSHPPY
jgi:hypothetical protein